MTSAIGPTVPALKLELWSAEAGLEAAPLAAAAEVGRTGGVSEIVAEDGSMDVLELGGEFEGSEDTLVSGSSIGPTQPPPPELLVAELV